MAERPHILLLAPTTTYRLDDFLAAARKADCAVTLATNRCHVLQTTPQQADTLTIQFENPDETAAALVASLNGRAITAVVPVDDAGTVLAAKTSAMLNLPGNSPEAAAQCRNKAFFRKALNRAALPGPRFRLISLRENPAAVVTRLGKKLFPCVLKPLSLNGSRGVIRADTRAEFVTAFNRIAALLAQPEFARLPRDERTNLLVESFLPGAEFAMEGILTGGSLTSLALFEKPIPLDGPFFEETIYLTPSGLDSERISAIETSVQAACRAVGLAHGPVHAEVRINDSGVYVIDLAPRTIGGLCGRALRFATGLSLEDLVLRHALGRLPAAASRETAAAGAMMLPIPAAGRLHAVSGSRAALAVPGIESVDITIPEGQMIVPLPEGGSYLGFLVARGKTRDAVRKSLEMAHAALEFDIRRSLNIQSN